MEIIRINVMFSLLLCGRSITKVVFAAKLDIVVEKTEQGKGNQND